MTEFSREFYVDAPPKMTRRHRDRIAGVSSVIAGMQDLALEVSVERVPEIIERADDELWSRYCEAMGDLDE